MVTKSRSLLENFIDKRVACIFIADMLVLHGIIFRNLDPCRMYAFYYIEFATFLISYSIYNVISDRRLDVAAILLSTLFMLFLMGIFILAAMKSIMPGKFENSNDFINLFYPFVDVPFYLVSIIGAHTLNVKKYLSFETDAAKTEFSKLLLYNFFLIPCLLIVAAFSFVYGTGIEFNMILALIVLRNFMEYKRYNGLQKLISIEKIPVEK